MKIKDLIKQLETYPPEEEVMIEEFLGEGPTRMGDPTIVAVDVPTGAKAHCTKCTRGVEFGVKLDTIAWDVNYGADRYNPMTSPRVIKSEIKNLRCRTCAGTMKVDVMEKKLCLLAKWKEDHSK